MAKIELRDVTKRYGDGYEAVKHMDLEIQDGEFMILVGPSGCGKSTALRMIAGLEDISEGELLIGEQGVNDKAPKDRDIAMVFQSYALYPHMTVRDNMGFALKLANVDAAEIDRKVTEAAKILDLTQHLDRKPANLSGGQRQRVAMGRAIVRDPKLFLMDEPLSNLDAKLRVQMRTEVSRLQDRLGTTTVYVTHDQTEAMTLGDRVAVMRADHSPKPVLLLVLDGIRPDVLRAAIREGEAPALGALVERGEAVWDASSVFPSVTPAATAAIVTGEPPVGSGIYGHAWYNGAEDRVVIYGAMTETVITSGPLQVLHNNVWRMNRDDLYAATLFERLHDLGVEGACVNYPIRRGPYRHRVRMRTLEGVANAGELLDTTVDGPKEYYMGDLFYSRDLSLHGRRGSGGLRRQAGINDAYAAKVGAALLREGAEPFTLVYFFEGDSLAHHRGIAAQRRYLGTLDGYVAEMLEAGGGAVRVLDEYAVLVVSDHGQDR